ncbi:TPA: phage filamentation protein Fil family protein [Serratia marcescens]|nr:DUF2724 domain-containing protein [Serratia marcescens]
MKAFAHYLKRQSPAPQLASFGHGWIELPNGQRWQPCASRVVFSGDSVTPGKQAKRRPRWFRLMRMRG